MDVMNHIRLRRPHAANADRIGLLSGYYDQFEIPTRILLTVVAIRGIQGRSKVR
jgi:hypothetical protein